MLKYPGSRYLIKHILLRIRAPSDAIFLRLEKEIHDV